MEIFNDKILLAKVLNAAIKEEATRIIDTNVALADDVNAFVEQAVANDNSPDTSLISLSNVYKILSNAKIPGDFKFKRASISDDKSKSEFVVVDEIDEDKYVKVSVNNLIRKLESYIHELGLNGKHVKANIIERKLDELRSIANRNDIVISKELSEKINKNG